MLAIDGPAGSGKSSVARTLACRYGMTYIDTGAMYRSVALRARRLAVRIEDVAALGSCAREAGISFQWRDGAQRVFLDGEDVSDAIRQEDISALTSVVSAVPAVREAMVALQRQLGAAGKVVMEGRDIGTVVFPNAACKVFLTATLEERARRRARELAEKAQPVDEGQVRREMSERDARDEGRDVAPLVPAPDAVSINTDGLTLEEVAQRIASLLPPAARAAAVSGRKSTRLSQEQ